MGTWGCCGEPRGDGDPRNVTHCGARDPECWGCCGAPYGDGDLRVLWGTPLRWGPTEVKCYMAHHTDGDLENWGSCGAPWGAGGSLGNPVVMGVRWDPRAAAGVQWSHSALRWRGLSPQGTHSCSQAPSTCSSPQLQDGPPLLFAPTCCHQPQRNIGGTCWWAALWVPDRRCGQARSGDSKVARGVGRAGCPLSLGQGEGC